MMVHFINSRFVHCIRVKFCYKILQVLTHHLYKAQKIPANESINPQPWADCTKTAQSHSSCSVASNNVTEYGAQIGKKQLQRELAKTKVRLLIQEKSEVLTWLKECG